MDQGVESTNLDYANKVMIKALDVLREEERSKGKSPANTSAQLFLETAMMWNNKDRKNKGEFNIKPTI